MYRIGEKSQHRSKVYLVLLFAFVFLAIGGYWAVKHFLRADTQLSQSAGVIRHVDVATPPTKQIDKPQFTMTIPASWKAVQTQRIPHATYAWQGTEPNERSRWLEIYVDNIPETMAFNRLLPLAGGGARPIMSDTISDNCVNFTDEKQADPITGNILAKWSNVSFYCDASKSQRNVIATGSVDGINTVKLTGEKSGVHRLLFVYTDHGASPDDTPFTDILNSFQMK